MNTGRAPTNELTKTTASVMMLIELDLTLRNAPRATIIPMLTEVWFILFHLPSGIYILVVQSSPFINLNAAAASESF
ncbi:hypothetical protein EX30DRAFT_371518 [Ascodesmis nigricans]|uniref:Uncharacterized protein n=1 Tax=Ascodesmis nigricans TaxID=341454 RepID=A0A4S2MWZ2_9PEZI|nr:hypothetical protein EX30DRAFT_371518 [Ascodesmis nigricans]